jgi:serine/arginine repetitive matrix protein 2
LRADLALEAVALSRFRTLFKKVHLISCLTSRSRSPHVTSIFSLYTVWAVIYVGNTSQLHILEDFLLQRMRAVLATFPIRKAILSSTCVLTCVDLLSLQRQSTGPVSRTSDRPPAFHLSSILFTLWTVLESLFGVRLTLASHLLASYQDHTMPRSDSHLVQYGRTSRGSNVSTGSRCGPPRAGGNKPDMFAAPGVISMLRSSTELGNDALFNPPSRFSAVNHRPQSRRSGTSSRMSTGSGHSSSKRASNHYGSSHHQAWPSISSAGRRRSITSNISNLTVPHYLDTMPPSLANLPDSGIPPPAPYFRDGSGRSFSLTTTSQSSMPLTNYRSLTSLRGHEPIQRPRSPYKYPTRLKRPGYRPSSPALSDITGLPSRSQHHRLESGLRMAHGLGMLHGPGLPAVARPAPLYSATRNRSNHSIASLGGYEQMPGAFPGPRRRTPSNSEHSVSDMMSIGFLGPRRGTPCIPDHSSPAMSSGGYSIPCRTPATDPMTPGQYPGLFLADQSSSDPASSAPPTPRDLPSASSTEPSIMQSMPQPLRVPTPASANAPLYYDYSEQFDLVDKEVAQIYYETTNSPIPFGFVQRIKTILEDRAIIERNAAPLHTITPTVSLVEVPNNEIHELPATPVIKRITRELILANLDPSSDLRNPTTPTIARGLEGIVESNDYTIEETFHPTPAVELPTIEHEGRNSAPSVSMTDGTNSSSSHLAVPDYALRYSTRRSTITLDSGLEIYLATDRTDEIVTPSQDKDTEPVKIATAEIEVASPTPTHPLQSPWTPTYSHPAEPSRAQSAFLTSSIYSSSLREGTTRLSTPTVRTDWPLKEESESSKHSNSRYNTQRPSEWSHAPGPPICSHIQHHSDGSIKQCPSDFEHQSGISYTQRHSLTNHVLRMSSTSHVHRPSDNTHVHRASDIKLTRIPSISSATIQDSTSRSHVQRNSNATLKGKKTFEESQVCSLSTIEVPICIHPTIEHNAQPFSSVNSPMSTVGEVSRRTSTQQYQSSDSPVIPEENRRESADLTSIWSYRKPVPKRTSSPFCASARASLKEFETHEKRDLLKDNTMDNSTTDVRFSALRPLLRQLDDVTEEPSLEHSYVDLRSSTFRFPLPQRKSSLRHFESFRLSKELKETNGRDSAQSFALCPKSRTSSEQQRSKDSFVCPPSGAMVLADMRAIPSLNFSRQDLFSKLNDAFDLRRTTSCDEFPQLVPPSESRPVSSSLMREKYRSFFQTLDGMTNDRSSDIQINDDGQEQSLKAQISMQRESARLPSPLCPMSTEELITELERISMPSLNGLTQRLSELLPSLKRYYGDTGEVIYEEETVRSAIEEIRKLGQLAEVTNEDGFNISEKDHFEKSVIVVDGLSNSPAGSLFEPTSNLQAVRPRSASSPGLRVDGPVPSVPELEALCSAVLRSRSLSDGINSSTIAGYSSVSRLTRISDRSLRGSPASRPWNVDANYPWADSVPSIDISLPAPTLRRDVIKQKPSRLRLRVSRGSRSDTDNVDTEVDSNTARIDVTDSTGRTADTFRLNHKRKTSKRSILGSLTRKIVLGASIDQGGFATGREILGGEDRTVDPGDRYPTTGLSPPSALDIDEVRSFFSDDSSAHGEAAVRGVSFRKRLTNLRTRIPPIARAHSALEHRCVHPGPDLRRSNSLFVPNSSALSTVAGSVVAYGDGVAGMPKTEFRAKKLVDRMKTLWYKGGELLRSLSGKKKSRGSQPHDWEDSGESANWSNL